MIATPRTNAHQAECLRSGGRSCDGGRNAYWLARELERELHETQDANIRLGKKLAAVLDEKERLEAAVTNLIAAKGRYHTELAFEKLVEALAAVKGGGQ